VALRGYFILSAATCGDGGEHNEKTRKMNGLDQQISARQRDFREADNSAAKEMLLLR
jgi:hypothetical protein